MDMQGGFKKKKEGRPGGRCKGGGGVGEACSDRVEACGACEQTSVALHCRDGGVEGAAGAGEQGGVQRRRSRR